jgi:NAD(P)-dependent dehydrogenase (short-subunit alcohol dehydrogenase family)
MLLRGDVRDAAFCRDAVEQVHERFGRLDILVNNAAFQEHAEKLTDLTEERFDDDDENQHLRLLPHGQGGALPYLKRGASRSSIPVR